VTAAADAETADWYHYDLTEDGLRALHDGRLPRFEIGPLLEARARVFSPREFRLLTTEGVRVAARYSRPFTIARLSLTNLEALRQQRGSVEIHLAFRLAVDTIVETLRESDFVVADGSESLVIGFPETPAEAVEQIIERVRRTIRETIARPIELSAEVAVGDDVVDLLAEDR
jgi:GGDEF domain-containing protein